MTEVANERLTRAEVDALEWLRARDGSILTSALGDRTSRDVFGDFEPGMAVFRRLAKRELVMITDEDLIDPEDPDLGTYTPTVELTDAGRIALANANTVEN